MPFSVANTEEIELHLGSNPYLSEGGLPGVVDAQIYFDFGKLPDKAHLPNTHYWYLFINSFSNDLLKKWIEKAKAPEKKQEEKKSEPAKTEEDDLFGDAPSEAPKPKKEAKKPVADKKKPAAKSIVVFDVKVYEQETDLDALAVKVLALKVDGLVWNNQPKKLDVAYGIQKLQFGCVIEDDKVPTDDIFDPIEAWEEVQSVDMINMQKL